VSQLYSRLKCTISVADEIRPVCCVIRKKLKTHLQLGRARKLIKTGVKVMYCELLRELLRRPVDLYLSVDREHIDHAANIHRLFRFCCATSPG
jgi:hypothetical protein